VITFCYILFGFLNSDLIWYSKFNNEKGFQNYLGEIEKYYDPNKFPVNLNRSIPSIWKDYDKTHNEAFFFSLLSHFFLLFFCGYSDLCTITHNYRVFSHQMFPENKNNKECES
jgi:hypothetical protein